MLQRRSCSACVRFKRAEEERYKNDDGGKRAHLLAAEPKHLPALFERRRASSNWKTCQATTRSQLRLSNSLLPSLSESHFHPVTVFQSLSLYTHTHTQSLTTPFLSSSVLFDRCHGDYKDTRISWWGAGTERRKCACFKDLSVEFLWYYFLKLHRECVLPVQLNSSPIMLGDKYPLEFHWRRPLSKEVRHDDRDVNWPEVLLNYYRFHIMSVYDSRKHNIKWIKKNSLPLHFS